LSVTCRSQSFLEVLERTKGKEHYAKGHGEKRIKDKKTGNNSAYDPNFVSLGDFLHDVFHPVLSNGSSNWRFSGSYYANKAIYQPAGS